MAAEVLTREELFAWYRRNKRSTTSLAYIRQDPDPETFFADEVFEGIVDHVLALVFANLHRTFDESGAPPRLLEVSVGVSVVPTAAHRAEVPSPPE